MSDVRKRGFASMSPARLAEVASKGGKSVDKEKRSFSQDHDLAARAGKKGGQAKARGMGTTERA